MHGAPHFAFLVVIIDAESSAYVYDSDIAQHVGVGLDDLFQHIEQLGVDAHVVDGRAQMAMKADDLYVLLRDENAEDFIEVVVSHAELGVLRYCHKYI